MENSRDPRYYIEVLFESRGALYLDRATWHLAGRGDAAIDAACGVMLSELRRNVPEAMAVGLTGAFASIVRDRLARPKH